jgi:hypothetical protein
MLISFGHESAAILSANRGSGAGIQDRVSGECSPDCNASFPNLIGLSVSVFHHPSLSASCRNRTLSHAAQLPSIHLPPHKPKSAPASRSSLESDSPHQMQFHTAISTIHKPD